jgi:hypothetical protein
VSRSRGQTEKEAFRERGAFKIRRDLEVHGSFLGTGVS